MHTVIIIQKGGIVKMNETLFFGLAMKNLRLNKNMSQEELAFSSGLHRTYISDVERGNRNISLSNIFKIAKALDVSPSRLLQEMESYIDEC
jgi:transcriptional regulator with XRE-family HTH domain